MSANDGAEAPLKAGITHKVVVPSPTSPEPCSRESGACCTPCSEPSREGPSCGASACSPPARLGSHSTWGASGHPSTIGKCSEQPPAVASQLPAPSSLPAAPGWGWGCGGVSQSRMPIWNPLGTFNPPHPFWCCLGSPPPTHTNAAIQAVNLNKFCPAATSRSDEKAT